ncbi:hypothetical protein PFICI_06734 [Pestalotiopsis fici W106-1]|uniref:Uncharacterized protein n=1 Tax=Pestalotiopsis fici (strain W106-1 / CGMCC3.15140) TaxID=1229662 RepID=W3X8M2_PESFW|nr:uncharacterized protein PFICI_06734 [Pestalotiopsis fici W106-1]ETS81732.1 hypothetical protein PFICI_06734 [Pestalotiopsis fici W106-1]
MTVEDFFTFDEHEYARRISDLQAYPNERLIKQEVVKLRQKFASSWSIGAGIGASPVTFGGSLAVSIVALRRRHVASKKNALIIAELAKRGIEPQKLQKRDFMIPMVAGIVGMGVGCGIEHIAMNATNAPKETSPIQQVVEDPLYVPYVVDDGMAEQAKEIAVQARAQGVIPESDISGAVLQDHTNWSPVSPTDTVRYDEGMLALQLTEKALVAFAADKCAWWTTEAMAGLYNKDHNLKCPRILEGVVECIECSQVLTAGTYWPQIAATVMTTSTMSAETAILQELVVPRATSSL